MVSNETVAGDASQAFARYLHHRHSSVDLPSAGAYYRLPRDTLILFTAVRRLRRLIGVQRGVNCRVRTCASVRTLGSRCAGWSRHYLGVAKESSSIWASGPTDVD